MRKEPLLYSAIRRPLLLPLSHPAHLNLPAPKGPPRTSFVKCACKRGRGSAGAWLSITQFAVHHYPFLVLPPLVQCTRIPSPGIFCACASQPDAAFSFAPPPRPPHPSPLLDLGGPQAWPLTSEALYTYASRRSAKGIRSWSWHRLRPPYPYITFSSPSHPAPDICVSPSPGRLLVEPGRAAGYV